MMNVKEKVEKARSSLGVPEPEVVEAACTTNPVGTLRRMMASELGGAVAGAESTDLRSVQAAFSA